MPKPTIILEYVAETVSSNYNRHASSNYNKNQLSQPGTTADTLIMESA